MRSSQLYIGIIVLGVIALIVGILYFANVLGVHPTRAYAALIVGVILIIIGAVGMFMKPRSTR